MIPQNKVNEALINKICRAFDRAAFEKDYIIVGGTGHAGVGAVFNLSNADVAKRLDAKGHHCCAWRYWASCSMKTAINQAPFEKAGVEVIGAIINKVKPSRLGNDSQLLQHCSRASGKHSLL